MGFGSEAETKGTRASGFDHHLTKPADVDELLGIIARSKSE